MNFFFFLLKSHEEVKKKPKWCDSIFLEAETNFY